MSQASAINVRNNLSQQNRAEVMQQALNRLPEPQGHGSFRPSFSTNSLSPWTIRRPRLTRLSELKACPAFAHCLGREIYKFAGHNSLLCNHFYSRVVKMDNKKPRPAYAETGSMWFCHQNRGVYVITSRVHHRTPFCRIWNLIFPSCGKIWLFRGHPTDARR